MNKRPVFLNLFQIKFPVYAIVSISHRVTGVILFLAIPYCLYLLEMSLISSSSWNSLKRDVLSNYCHKLFLWAIITSIALHFVAGIRHLIMDFGFWENKKSANISSYGCFLLTAIISVFFGVWLW